MLKLVYGPKGTGKTKIILDDVNKAAEIAKGNVVFITDKRISSVSININVRCVYTEEYEINSIEGFNGFIKGLLAGNSDIEYLFIDGIARITKGTLDEVESLLASLSGSDLNVEMTISSSKEDMPAYMLAYLK